MSSRRTLCLILGPEFFLLFLSKSFIALTFTYKSIILSKLIFLNQIWGLDWSSTLFFPQWLSDFCNTICWTSCLSSTESLLHLAKDQIGSVAQSCPTLCDPMNRSRPGLPVHHQLPEFTETHLHWVSDAIQPSHPLSSPSPPAPNPSQHQSLFQWVNSSHEVAKVPEFQL